MICTGQLEQAACKSPDTSAYRAGYDDVKIIGIPLLYSTQSTYLQLPIIHIIHQKFIDYWNN
jgi:hypothetical protein